VLGQALGSGEMIKGVRLWNPSVSTRVLVPWDMVRMERGEKEISEEEGMEEVVP